MENRLTEMTTLNIFRSKHALNKMYLIGLNVEEMKTERDDNIRSVVAVRTREEKYKNNRKTNLKGWTKSNAIFILG